MNQFEQDMINLRGTAESSLIMLQLQHAQEPTLNSALMVQSAMSALNAIETVFAMYLNNKAMAIGESPKVVA